MDNSNILLKSINEIINCNFLIPSYQRGYRWNKQQILELLNDIYEFISLRTEGKEFYCLQPIITRKSGSLHRVIDGQQRLTTVYIILSFLEKKKFSIEYETRPKSKDFLENFSEEMADSNVDFYHISKARSYIQSWFAEKEEEEPTVADEFYINLGKYTKFIWYEIDSDEDEINVFTRINSGKIPLTNAELIKGLFLNSRNFNSNEQALRKIEIAKEWDEMEHSLQDDELWYFLTSKEKEYPTRIELLFEIFSDVNIQDEFTTYRYFAHQNRITPLWSKADENIKKVFLSLKYWFNDRELYHLIGYLISTRTYSINSIYQQFKNLKKSEFKDFLYKEVKSKFDIKTIEELDYDSDSQNIKNILLLFNMATILNNSNSYIRFSYDKFNKENWTLEHIHAQKSEGLRSSEAKKEWLKSTKNQIRKTKNIKATNKRKILKEINILIDGDKLEDDSSFQQMQDQIFQLYGEPNVNTIDNLALLSRDINSSLSNNIFPIKRKILIEKDTGGEFIPICTKNVFLKYYSQNAQNLHFWGENDRLDYLKEIKNSLTKF